MKTLENKFTYNDKEEYWTSNKTYFGLSPSEDSKLIVSLCDDFSSIYYKSKNGREIIIFDSPRGIKDEKELKTVFKLLDIKL